MIEIPGSPSLQLLLEDMVKQMFDATLLGFIGVIVTMLAVGVGLATLILKGQQSTNERIDGLGVRIVELEKGQARLEGYLAGMQSRTPAPDS